MADQRFELRVLRQRFLGGPNVWTYRSAMEVWLDLGELEQHPSHTLPGLTDRLLAWLPALEEHHCGVGERGGFIQRLREGTWAGHILEHCVIELLNRAGMPTGFGQTRSTSQTGVYRMVFRARNAATAEAALRHGLALLHAAIHGDAFDVNHAVNDLREVIDDTWLGPSTAAIVAAATERGIPHMRLNEGNLVQLGHGACQRRIWTAETDLTSAIAENIASDKDLTKSLLQAAGVPVPEGQVVDSPAQAWDAAQDIGLPVVVKPSDANHGRGVSLELTTQAEVEQAFVVADAEGSEVMVERFIAGNEHRLLVVGGHVVAASRGESLWVTGDGVQALQALIDQQLNTDPRRGEAEEFPLDTIHLDRAPTTCFLLERQGLTPTSVPLAGQRVLVQRNGNMAFDCTDEVHPDVAYAAALAARVVGLDIAGIDLVTTDIRQPLQVTGGAVVEVNAGPGLLMHLKPAVGQPRPVGEAIVAHLFPVNGPLGDGRMALVGITGTAQSTLLSRLTGHLLGLSHGPVGVACRDGIFLGARRLEKAGSDYWHQCQRLLMNREVRCAVIESRPDLILDQGMPYDRCMVGVVTDLDGWPELARHDIHARDGMTRVVRTQMDVVLSSGAAVLNADVADVAALADFCDGQIIWTSLQAPAVDEPAAQRSVRCVHGQVQLCVGAQIQATAPLPELAVLVAPEVVCAAAAAAWAVGMSPALIAAGLDNFAALPGA